MKSLKYRVTVEFTVPADDPTRASECLTALKAIGDVVKVQASATKVKE
jgi:hypothetical protein